MSCMSKRLTEGDYIYSAAVTGNLQYMSLLSHTDRTKYELTQSGRLFQQGPGRQTRRRQACTQASFGL